MAGLKGRIHVTLKKTIFKPGLVAWDTSCPPHPTRSSTHLDNIPNVDTVTQQTEGKSLNRNQAIEPANDSQVTARVVSMLMVPRATLSGSAPS